MTLRHFSTKRAVWLLATLLTLALLGVACQDKAENTSAGGDAKETQGADSAQDKQGDEKAQTPPADATPKTDEDSEQVAEGDDKEAPPSKTPKAPADNDAKQGENAQGAKGGEAAPKPDAEPKAPGTPMPAKGRLAINADKLRRVTPVRNRPILKDIPLKAMGKGGSVTMKWLFERQGKRANAQPDEPERVRVILRLERGDWSREIDTGVTQAGCRATPASRLKDDQVMAASCFWAGQGFKLSVRRVKRLILLERVLVEDGKQAKERDPEEVSRLTLPPGASVLLARPETINKRP